MSGATNLQAATCKQTPQEVPRQQAQTIPEPATASVPPDDHTDMIEPTGTIVPENEHRTEVVSKEATSNFLTRNLSLVGLPSDSESQSNVGSSSSTRLSKSRPEEGTCGFNQTVEYRETTKLEKLGARSRQNGETEGSFRPNH